MTDLAGALGNPDARWITVAEAARKLEMSEAKVRRQLEIGGLHGAKVFGRVAVLEASVIAWPGRTAE
jgi:hypothetical protein